jgi:hypothetical protein
MTPGVEGFAHSRADLQGQGTDIEACSASCLRCTGILDAI